MNLLRTTCLAFFATLALTFSACDDETEPLRVPSSYESAQFSANAATELGVLTRLRALRDEAFKGRSGAVVDASVLSGLYTAGTPSLKALNTTYYNQKIEGENGFLNQLARSSGKVYTPGTPQGDGGVYGGYLFDENGVEMEQLIEKGMFGSALYNHALTLLNGPLDATTTDKVVAIFGASPSFPNSTDATKHESPDRYAASYTARRDKNDGSGFYTKMRDSFIRLKAAIEAGDDYRADQQAAIASIKENWEKANAATVANYLHDVLSKLSETNPTVAQRASALHSLAEAIGFVDGWKTIPDADKIVTDAQIDEIVALFLAPNNGAATTYKFAVDETRAAELPKIQQALEKIRTIYGFTAAEMEDFKKNWVSVQAR